MKNWGFCGQSYTGYSSAASAEETINLFPETIKQTTTRAQTNLLNVPGKRSFATRSGTGQANSIYEQDGRCFTVAGPFFDEIKADGTTTAWSTLSAGGTRPVTLIGNGARGNQILISTSGTGAVFNTSTNTLTAVTHASFPADVITVGFIDGYGIAVTPDRFTLSALFDMTTWSGGTGQRSGAPGRTVGAICDHELLWLFGEQQTEVWYDSGAASFPFAPVPSVFIECGLAASHAVTKIGDSLIWLTQDERGRRSIVRNQQYDPVTVSTPAIDARLAACTTVSDFRAWSYTALGHTFAVFSSVANALSLQFDVTEGQWSRLGYWNTTTGQWEADRGVGFVYAFGKRLTVDRTTADVWELTPDVYYDGGTQPRRWLRQSPYLADEGQLLFHQRAELFAQMGVGNSATPDPTVELRWSDDEVNSWSNPIVRSIGATGKYANRAVFGGAGGLGASRKRVYQLSGSAPAKTVLVDLVLNVVPGVA